MANFDVFFVCEKCGGLLKPIDPYATKFSCSLCGAGPYHTCPECDYPALIWDDSGLFCLQCAILHLALGQTECYTLN